MLLVFRPFRVGDFVDIAGWGLDDDDAESPCIISDLNMVSPSGVKTTSPKMSSKFNVEGFPRCANAACAAADKES